MTRENDWLKTGDKVVLIVDGYSLAKQGDVGTIKSRYNTDFVNVQFPGQDIEAICNLRDLRPAVLEELADL